VTATHLTLSVTALVLGAGVLHATWNAIASAIKDKLVAVALIGATETLVAALCLPLTGLPRAPALAFVGMSAAVHVGYTYALLHSYRLGEFGRAYPLARGTSPLLVAIGAWFLAATAWASATPTTRLATSPCCSCSRAPS
jgi:hypothetical protein